MNKKIIFKNILILILILFLVIHITYSQSIGATPRQTIEVKTNTPTLTDFGISQGSDYPEKITIEGYYDWLVVEERNFILQSKSGRTIKLSINLKRPGTYSAILKICGSPITPEGAALSTKACTSHNLNVIATLDKGTITLYVTLTASITLFIISFLIFFIKRSPAKHRTQIMKIIKK